MKICSYLVSERLFLEEIEGTILMEQSQSNQLVEWQLLSGRNVIFFLTGGNFCVQEALSYRVSREDRQISFCGS